MHYYVKYHKMLKGFNGIIKHKSIFIFDKDRFMFFLLK